MYYGLWIRREVHRHNIFSKIHTSVLPFSVGGKPVIVTLIKFPLPLGKGQINQTLLVSIPNCVHLNMEFLSL